MLPAPRPGKASPHGAEARTPPPDAKPIETATAPIIALNLVEAAQFVPADPVIPARVIALCNAERWHAAHSVVLMADTPESRAVYEYVEARKAEALAQLTAAWREQRRANAERQALDLVEA